MPVLLVLKGAASKGKSSVLRNLIKLLFKSEYQETNLSEGFNEKADCFVVAEKDGRSIAVITYGDPGYEADVKDKLLKCHENNIDFIVASSRTRYQYGSIYKILWDFVQENQYYGIETSTIVVDHNFGKKVDIDQVNLICAENLLNIINKY